MSALKAQPDVTARRPLQLVPSRAERRRALSDRVAYALAAGVIGLGLFASITPSPLYHAYSVLWHFSPLTLTLVYATYAFGVLASLLLVGGVSDAVGRRPVLLVALGGLMAATVLFMLADSAAWLFVARGLQGVSTGAALSAASAALLDLHPRRDPTGAGLTNGIAATVGIGLGILVSSSLVRIGLEPRVLPYALLLVLGAVAFAGVYWMPEPVRERSGLRLSVERPKVPSVVRSQFVLAGLAVLSSWSIAALFFSLGPELSSHLFDSTNVIVSGIGIVALAGSATLAQLLTGRTAPWVAASTGSIALAAGMVMIVFASATDSSASYVLGSILGGAGFGAAFLGGLRALVGAIPPEHRAAVMAAFFVVAYVSLSVPAVLAGVLVTHISLESTFEIFGSAVAALALLVALQAWRTRPKRRPVPLTTGSLTTRGRTPPTTQDEGAPMDELLSAVPDAHGGLDAGAVAMTATKLQPRTAPVDRSKLVSWHDPAELRAGAAGRSGREFLEAIIAGEIPPPPMAALVGADLLAIGDGEHCSPAPQTSRPTTRWASCMADCCARCWTPPPDARCTACFPPVPGSPRSS